MQRQGTAEAQGATRPRDSFGAAHAASFRVVQTHCRRILFVTQDVKFEKGALEFADIRCLPAKVTDFERALDEVNGADKDGLVVVVDLADFERGLAMRRQVAGLDVHVISLAKENPTKEQTGRLDEVRTGPTFFIKDFEVGAGHYLDMVLSYC